MNQQTWRWLRRLPRLLAAPHAEPAQQEQRIIAVQRNIIPPVKLVAIGIVLYYLFFSPWVSEVASTYAVVLETIQRLFGVYVGFSAAVIASFFLVRRFPPGLVQWIVFAVGLVDGLFLSGLAVLTGGFDSIMYWVFPGVIVLNAVCIPLAMPQIVLNLALCAFFFGAGLLESNTRYTEASVPNLQPRPRQNFNTEDIATRLPTLAAQLKQRSDPLYNTLWNRLSESTRQKLSDYTGPGPGDREFAQVLAEELNRAVTRYAVSPSSASDASDNAAEPYVLRLVVLLLLTFCSYGLQVLAARQELAEEERKEFASRTEQLHSAGRLAAEVAHQIKNPLAIINNAAFSLRRALNEGKAGAAQQVEIIQEEVARADQIITQIMGYAQLSEGRVEKLSVTEELDRAIEQVFPRAVTGGVLIQRRYATDFPPLLMLRRHLFEIFANLLQNAREALNGKGNLVVTAECRGDYSVEVSVQDDGPGIAPEKLEQIFEAYYTAKERGTGLGLAIVKHNVELYGGSVRVESELGKGAKFTLLFPAKTLMRLNQ